MDSKSTSRSVDYSKLFVLDENFRNKKIVRVDLTGDHNKLMTEQYGRFWIDRIVSGELDPEVDLQFRVDRGAIWNDIAFSNSVGIVFISNRLLSRMTKEGLTGWRFKPTTIVDKKKMVHEQYHLLIVTGRSGALDESRCREYILPPFKEGLPPRREWKGVHFQDDFWDGSDVFLMKGGRGIKVTEKAKQVIEDFKVTNVEFEALESKNCIPMKRWNELKEEGFE